MPVTNHLGQETLTPANAVDTAIFGSSFDYNFYATADNLSAQSPETSSSCIPSNHRPCPSLPARQCTRYNTPLEI